MRMPMEAAMGANCGERYILRYPYRGGWGCRGPRWLAASSRERRPVPDWDRTGVRDESAGIVQRGLEEDLHLAPAGALNPRAEQHVGLPDLIRKLRFVLLVCGGFVEQQLALGEPAGAQETIERGSRKTGLLRSLATANSRSRAAPVRCGFSRLSRSMRAAVSGATARVCPRS